MQHGGWDEVRFVVRQRGHGDMQQPDTHWCTVHFARIASKAAAQLQCVGPMPSSPCGWLSPPHPLSSLPPAPAAKVSAWRLQTLCLCAPPAVLCCSQGAHPTCHSLQATLPLCQPSTCPQQTSQWSLDRSKSPCRSVYAAGNQTTTLHSNNRHRGWDGIPKGLALSSVHPIFSPWPLSSQHQLVVPVGREKRLQRQTMGERVAGSASPPDKFIPPPKDL